MTPFPPRLIWICVTLSLTGCTGTIIPQAVNAKSPDVTGGTLAIPVAVPGGWRINGETADKYRALVKLYDHRKEFLIPLDPAAGLRPDPGAPDYYIIDAEHLIDFGRMAGWYRAEMASPK